MSALGSEPSPDKRGADPLMLLLLLRLEPTVLAAVLFAFTEIVAFAAGLSCGTEAFRPG